MSKNLNLKKQAILYTCGNYFRVLVALIINAVLSRILSPDDFGVAAVVFVFTTLFVTLSDVGIGPAIVQIKSLTKDEINDIYTITLYAAFILALLFCCISIPIAQFYERKIYIPIGLLLSVSVFFNIANMVPNGLLNKEKRFVLITVRSVLVNLFSSVITITLAFKGVGVYALVADTIIVSLLSFVVNYQFTKPIFKRKVDFSGFQKIAEFSGFQFAFNIICYVSRNLDNLLTGKYISSSELGYYNKAYTFMLYPINNLTGVFTPVLHPVLSEYQKEPAVIYRKYKKIARLCMLAGGIVSITCFMCSSEMITIVCGSNWERAAVCFKWMSIAMVPQMLNSCVGAIYQSIGNTRLLFLNSCINVSASILAIAIGVFYFKDIISLSICIAVAYFFHFFAAHYMLLIYGFRISFFNFIISLKKEIVVLIGTILMCSMFHFSSKTVIGSLVMKVGYVGTTYIFLVIVSGEHRFIREFIRMIKNAE